MKYKVLTEEQEKLVQWVIDRVRLMQPQTPTGDPPPSEYHSPDVYLVRTPADGIPGLTRTEAGTGSGTSEFPDSNDLPGSATCDVYQIADDGSLQQVDNVTITVYNISALPIRPKTLITVKREKYGAWLVDQIPHWILRGQTTADVAPGAQADVAVYEGTPGAEAPTAAIIEQVYNLTSCTIKANTMQTILYMPEANFWQFLIYKTT